MADTNMTQEEVTCSIDRVATPPGAEHVHQAKRDLVMAWAVDVETGEPRYILQLDAAHRGRKSNCKCPSCNLPLQAINNAKTEFIKRPHFRHPEGAAREHCVIIAARKAVEEMFSRQGQIVLPRRQRHGNVEGLSGQYYNAWVERPPERARLSSCHFSDEATAILTLDDGRCLLVTLVGRNANTGSATNIFPKPLAHIEISVDDPTVAMMSPQDIFARLELAWSEACWRQHWCDAELDQSADAKARQAAAAALDWLDDGDLMPGLTATERRETLLHREVKAILERERRIRLPGLHEEVERRRADGFLDRRVWSTPDIDVDLSLVKLEVHLGISIPDVLIEWRDEEDPGWVRTAFVEVTVTNRINDERIDRLSSFGWPVLEIDIGRMGGIVTREELTRLVVEEVAGKRWLFHPDLVGQEAVLIADMERTARKTEQGYLRTQELKSVSASEWAHRYLMAFRRRWEAQRSKDGEPDTDEVLAAQNALTEAADGLKQYGYHEIADAESYRLRTKIARILSIKLGLGVEYKFPDAWGVINAILCDRQPLSIREHTLYLIALRVYRPVLSSDHSQAVARWRERVMQSIENGETLNLRDACHDRLLGILFPEMRDALAHPFGTMLHVADQQSKAMIVRSSSGGVLARHNQDDDEALLKASGVASRIGSDPRDFAKDYARQTSMQSVEEILLRLIELGVAKNQWSWS